MVKIDRQGVSQFALGSNISVAVGVSNCSTEVKPCAADPINLPSFFRIKNLLCPFKRSAPF